jgi:hypothetical protein
MLLAIDVLYDCVCDSITVLSTQIQSTDLSVQGCPRFSDSGMHRIVLGLGSSGWNLGTVFIQHENSILIIYFQII